jgi:transcriptional regulator with XRE-family HTH domain
MDSPSDSELLKLLVRVQTRRDEREIRMRNLDDALRQGTTTPQRLAKALSVNTSYVAQLRIGFRPITDELARKIEEAAGWPPLALDVDGRTLPQRGKPTLEVCGSPGAVAKQRCRQRLF